MLSYNPRYPPILLSSFTNIAVKVNQVEQQLSQDYVLFFIKAECIIRSIVKLCEIKQSTGEINYINQEEEELFKEEIIKVPGCE